MQMRPYVPIVALLLLISPFANASAIDSPNDISGVYQCVGTNPQGSNYKITLSIENWEDAYILKWRGPQSGGFVGTGLIHSGSHLLNKSSRKSKAKKPLSSIHTFIAANFWSIANTDSIPGLVIYEILPKGVLKGNWMISNQGIIGTETCTKDTTSTNETDLNEKVPSTSPKSDDSTPYTPTVPASSEDRYI